MKRMSRSLPACGLACLLLLAGMGAGQASAQAGVTVEDGVEYSAPDGKPLLLDIYHPAGQGPFAAVIVVHGGGWQFGDRKNLADTARYLAENGLEAFAIDYRLAALKNYSPYPAAVEDVRASIGWVRKHASDYHVDPSKIALLGSSTGAHLVSLVGMEGTGPLDQGDRVKAVVSWSGPQDVVELYNDAPHRAKVGVEKFTDCHEGLPACESLFREISPVTYVDSSDPPLLFANGTQELVPLTGALEMANALAQAGVPHLLVQVPGSLHAQHYVDERPPGLAGGQSVQEASLAWLRTWLLRNGVGAQTAPPPSPPPTSAVGPSKSGLTTALLLGAIGLAVAMFATVAILLTLRRRKRRRSREREWKEGQARYRYRSRPGSSSSSRSRSGSSSGPPSGSGSRSGSGSGSRSGSGSSSTSGTADP